MLKLFLWLRYLRKKKIVFLSIGAIALSCALLIVVDSLFTGLIEGIEQSTATQMGDILMWTGGMTAPQYEDLLDELAQIKGVKAAAPCEFSGGLLYLESGDVREVTVAGIEPDRERGFVDWKNCLLRQKTATGNVGFDGPASEGATSCWVGIAVIAEPNEKTDEYDPGEINNSIGKNMVLTTVDAGGKRKVIKLRVSDIASTQTYYGDKTVYLPFEEFYKLRHGEDQQEYVGTVKIKLSSHKDAESMKPLIRKQWERFAVERLGLNEEAAGRIHMVTVQENFGEYLGELYKQMQVLMLIFGVICSVVVLLVFCIFYMIVETRLKDIAIIKSCGASNGAAAAIFVGFAGCIGIAGAALGVIAGYIITRNINALEEWIRILFGLKLWRASSYMLNVIPNQLNWQAVWPIILVAVAACCLGALIPAVVAAKTKPVEILRYE